MKQASLDCEADLRLGAGFPTAGRAPRSADHDVPGLCACAMPSCRIERASKAASGFTPILGSEGAPVQCIEPLPWPAAEWLSPGDCRASGRKTKLAEQSIADVRGNASRGLVGSGESSPARDLIPIPMLSAALRSGPRKAGAARLWITRRRPTIRLLV